MKTIFALRLPACCLATAAATLTLAACASQSPTHSATANARRSSGGNIPTRDDRHSVEVASGGTGGANGPEYRVPIGSQLPRQYNRRAYTTDAQDPSFTYDQNDIRLQSTNSVGDSLRSVPGVSVNGPR